MFRIEIRLIRMRLVGSVEGERAGQEEAAGPSLDGPEPGAVPCDRVAFSSGQRRHRHHGSHAVRSDSTVNNVYTHSY